MPTSLLNAALTALPVGVVVVDSQGEVLFANPSFRRLTGWSDTVLVGKNISLVLSASDVPLKDMLCAQWRGEVQCVSPSGVNVSLKMEVEHLLDGEREAYLFTFLPSSKFPQTTIEIGEEERQRRLEALGTLAGEVAHDLNNILTGILGHVSFLKLVLSEIGPHSDSLQAIEDSARKSARMTQQILEFARGGASSHETVNICKVLRDAASLFAATLPTDIRLNLTSLEQDLIVSGNETQLSQLVMNLLVNARDAITKGGSIEAGLSVVSVDKPILFGAQQLKAGNYVKLAIADTGMGMSDDVRRHIFDPFFTTKSKKGTGLGLAIAFSVVRSHKGLIRVESELGKGAKFEIFIPVSNEVHAITEESPKETTKIAVASGAERILIVDDEETVRIVVERSLEHLGYKVETASNGREALEKYSDRLGEFALIILDMMMPLMSGDEVFYRLKEIYPKVNVLIASGYASDTRTKAVLDAGAAGFIQKPFSVEEIAAEVRNCIDKTKNRG